jgi:hypothetical protein
MVYDVEMTPSGMVYIASFMKIGSGFQKLLGVGIHKQIYRQHGDLISLILFIHNKESRIISNKYFENVTVQVRLKNDSNKSELYILSRD